MPPTTRVAVKASFRLLLPWRSDWGASARQPVGSAVDGAAGAAEQPHRLCRRRLGDTAHPGGRLVAAAAAADRAQAGRGKLAAPRPDAAGERAVFLGDHRLLNAGILLKAAGEPLFEWTDWAPSRYWPACRPSCCWRRRSALW